LPNERRLKMTIEEFANFYTEGSFAIRDLEVQFNLNIGEELELQNKSDEEIKTYAKVIKKHKSFLIECIEVYKRWPELQKVYTKNMSWSDLVKFTGIEKEKRPRINLKEKIKERMEKYSQLSAHNLPDNDYYRGKYDEDRELLQELGR